MEASVLAGTTWLLVSRDLAWADGVARALRVLGATVRLLDVSGEGVSRLVEADAQVMLVADGPPDARLRAALDAHPGLRWAAPVSVDTEQVWPRGRATPDLDALMRCCGPALQRDREVRAQATHGRQISLDLHELGLPRLLRALADVPASFVVQLSLGRADAHVALANGQWIGASYQPRARSGERLEGMAALRAALDLREASCLVLPAGRLSTPAWKQPLDSALAHAITALNARRDEQVQAERTRPASRHPSGALTAQTIGPPKHRRGSKPPPRARRTSLLLAAAIGGFGVTALLALLLEGEPDAQAPRPVDARSQAPRVEAPPAGLSKLRVEPLRAAPVASAPHEETRDDAPEPSREAENAPEVLAAVDPSAEAEAEADADAPAGDDAAQDDGEDEQDEGRAGGSWHRSRRLARRAGRCDDPERARALYEEALGEDPRNPHAVVGLAKLARQDGNLSSAVQLLERATALRSRRVTYRVLLGYTLLDAGRPAEALEAFEHALRLRPDSRPARRGKHEARAAL